MRLRLATPPALLLSSWAMLANAEPTEFALLYRPVPECPAREAFVAELTARSPWLREGAGEAPDVSLEVWFEAADPLTGVIVLRDSDGRTTMRTVPGASCAEVSSALALIATLLIDQQRRETAAPEPTPAEPAPAAPAPARPEEDHGQQPIEDSSDEQKSGLKLGVGAGFAVEYGVAPDAALAGAGEISAAWTQPSILQPLLSATFERTLTDEEQTAAGVGRFRWTALRVAGCPLRLPAEGPLFMRPCAHFEAGMIDAQGTDTVREANATVPWWAIGIAERIEYLVADPLSFVLELGARLHLREDRFYFDPDSQQTTAFEVPPAGLFARAGIQAAF